MLGDMPGRLLVLDVVGLVPSLLGPHVGALARGGWQRSLAPVFPAVTCTAQASMLTGLLPPTSGEIAVCGWKLGDDPVELKRRIGVLPEDLGLFDDLTVEEHLHLTGDVYGVDRAETRARTDQLLRAFSLEHGRNTFAAACSHGMRKKTAFAMALLPNPQVLFLDEPFEAVDPVTSKVMRELLASVARRGVTVFLTSHILPVVERIATQLIIIRGGRILWDAPAGELPQSLEEHYLGLIEAPAVEELEWLGSARS